MPTTIYDSSLLTQRKRDKAIAQQIFQANRAGQPIIVPQSGYGSYLGGEADNGAITYFRKVGECTDVNLSCNCSGQISTTSSSIINNPEYLINITVAPSQLFIEIQLNGSGHIYWGDGTDEAFDTNGTTVTFPHTYSSSGDYTIRIATFITELILSNASSSGGGAEYPDVTSLTLINPEGLTQLTISCPNLTSVSGLDKCTNLTRLSIGRNSCNIDAIYQLAKLTNLELNDRPNLTSFDASSFPQLDFLVLSNSPVTSISNLPTSLITLHIDDTAITGQFDISNFSILNDFSCDGCAGITGLGTLPTSLTYLSIGGSGITGIFNLSSLTNLTSFDCSGCAGITGLGTLPTSLTNLIIGGSGITGTFDISSLTNLDTFNCSDSTGITGLGTLPTSLTSLSISGSGITEPFDISSLTNLNDFSCDGCAGITGLGTLPTSLTYLSISNTNITDSINVSGCTNLEGLYLVNSKITGLIGTANLTNLTTIDSFGVTTFTNTDIDVSGCTALIEVVFDDCKLTSLNITGCTSLSDIRLYGCSFTQLAANNMGAQLTLPAPGDIKSCDLASQTTGPITITGSLATASSNGWNILD
jgi:hypothetical protein